MMLGVLSRERGKARKLLAQVAKRISGGKSRAKGLPLARTRLAVLGDRACLGSRKSRATPAAARRRGNGAVRRARQAGARRKYQERLSAG